MISNKDTDTFDWLQPSWLINLEYIILDYTYQEALDDIDTLNRTVILNHRAIFSTLLKELYGRA